MNIENIEELEKQVQNPDLKSAVKSDSKLKELFVDYVGNKLQPKNGDVTVEMIVQVLAEEFPEFLMVVAEENFMRGYEQALSDKKIMSKELKKLKKKK